MSPVIFDKMGRIHIISWFALMSLWQRTDDIIQFFCPFQTKATFIWLYKSSIQVYNIILIVLGYLINFWQLTHIISFKWHKIHSAVDQLNLASGEG